MSHFAEESTDSAILDSIGFWLEENGQSEWLRWIHDLQTAMSEPDGAQLPTRGLIVRLGDEAIPVGLMSLLGASLDLIDCDPSLNSPVRVRRFVRGTCVLDVHKEEGFGRLELGAAMAWSYVVEGDEVHGLLAAALLIDGHKAPELEATIRSFIRVPYGIVESSPAYSYARLAVLVGAASVYLTSSDELAEWNRSQIVPAQLIERSPIALVSALVDVADTAQMSRVEPALSSQVVSRENLQSRILLVSYYAPPATPVSVQRLDYWHRQIPSIGMDEQYPVDVAWLTPTVSSATHDATLVVPDLGPWGINDRWFEVFKESKEAGIDTLGISWCHYVEEQSSLLGGPYTSVVLSGNPFHYFALADHFREWWGARIVLDFRDPFAYNPRFNWSVEQRAAAIRFELSWVEQADAVISVNDSCLETIAPHVSIDRHVVANGYDEELVDSAAAWEFTDSFVRVAYSGTVFPNLPLDALLDALPEHRMRLHHFGRDYSASQAVTGHHAGVAHGLVPYRELISKLKGCAIGVVLTSGEPSTQTTKLFDYLACDLDVVIITNGKPRTGNLHELTKDLEGVFWVRNSYKELSRFFSHYEPTWRKRPERTRFSRRHQTERLLSIIKHLEHQ